MAKLDIDVEKIEIKAAKSRPLNVTWSVKINWGTLADVIPWKIQLWLR